MRRKCLYIICLVISVFMIGCSTTQGKQATKQGEQKPVQITLDVYSGQPNPGWQLSSGEATELARRLAQLNTVAQDPGDGNLGYRGFFIQNEGQIAGIARTVRVFRNTVIIPDNKDQRKVYRDTQNITRWLQDQARAHGYGNVIDTIKDS